MSDGTRIISSQFAQIAGRVRRDRISSRSLLPAALASLLVVVTVLLHWLGRGEFTTPLLITGVTLCAAGLLAVAVTSTSVQPATQTLAETIFIVGRGPLAATVAAALPLGTRPSLGGRTTWEAPRLQPLHGQAAIRRLTTFDDLTREISQTKCRAIVFAESPAPIDDILVDGLGHPPLMLAATDVLSCVVGRIPLEYVREGERGIGAVIAPQASRTYAAIKRTLDIAIVTLLAVPVLILLPFVALVTRLDSPGPVFYHQVRVGRHGQLFRIYKFRSTRTGAEAQGAVWAQAADPRITRVGRLMRRTRIDELPQLWSILRGDMSLIGPRPERPEFTDQLERALPGYAGRHAVRPGLTGWAQVRFCYGSSIHDAGIKLEHDLFYVKNVCLSLDLVILLRTVPVVLRMRGQ